uniref:Neurotransmitter-gated ion-channel ligand-binding domain-containing protein n=1 Tax=Timema poppense TaxID=170557 RepID=A0A7R9H3J6_TIMPO|nr:unnamed protein product [Timema poppensis]
MREPLSAMLSVCPLPVCDYEVDLYLRQKWQDERLKHSEITEALDLNDPNLVKAIWKPEVYFPNAKHAEFQYVTVPNVLVRINPDGEILYMLRGRVDGYRIFKSPVKYIHAVGGYRTSISCDDELRFVTLNGGTMRRQSWCCVHLGVRQRITHQQYHRTISGRCNVPPCYIQALFPRPVVWQVQNGSWFVDS